MSEFSIPIILKLCKLPQTTVIYHINFHFLFQFEVKPSSNSFLLKARFNFFVTSVKVYTKEQIVYIDFFLCNSFIKNHSACLNLCFPVVYEDVVLSKMFCNTVIMCRHRCGTVIQGWGQSKAASR